MTQQTSNAPVYVRRAADLEWHDAGDPSLLESQGIELDEQRRQDVVEKGEGMLLQFIGDRSQGVHALRQRLEPARVVEPHAHDARSTCFVIAGSMWFGNRLLEAGDLYSAPAGQVYGPLVAGPEGVDLLHVFGEPDVAPTYRPVEGWWEKNAERVRADALQRIGADQGGEDGA